MMTGKKEKREKPRQPPQQAGKQVKEEINSDGSASAFDETEQAHAATDKEINDQQLDEWLDEKE